MNVTQLLLAFDIGFKSCEAGKDYLKSKISFIDTLRKGIKTK